MGARARLRDLGDRAGVGAARADRGAALGLGRAADRAGHRPRRGLLVAAPTRRSRSPSRCSRRAPRPPRALAFQFASTNLVWELGLVLWVLIGWQFTLAEYVGGIVMIVLMTVLLRLFVSPRLEARAREHAVHADTGHQHHTRRRADCRWRERLTSHRRVVGRRRTTSAATGRCCGRRSRSGFLLAGFIAPARQRLLQGLFIKHAPAAARDARERDRRPADRRAQLRLLGRQRPAGRGAVVGRDLVRRRARVPVRRPDRAADRAHLPQVLRRARSRCGSPR